MRLEAVNSSSRIATASSASIVFFPSSEGAKTDRVQRDIGTGGDFNRTCGRNHADRQQIEQRKGVFHATILPHPAQHLNEARSIYFDGSVFLDILNKLLCVSIGNLNLEQRASLIQGRID